MNNKNLKKRKADKQMQRQRKTDKYRIMEGRGLGEGADYESWFKIPREVPSKGRTTTLLGWKSRRLHILLSDKELHSFVNYQWEDDVTDIREQYPLLPLEQTIVIANELGIRHPSARSEDGKLEEIVMTTDFLITKRDGDHVYNIARDVKMSDELKKKRVLDKFKIVKGYWDMQDIDWGVVTEKEISEVKGRNLFFLYHDYFWAEEHGIAGAELLAVVDRFKSKLARYNFDLYKTIDIFDRENYWESGTSLNFFRYLLVKKEILTDFNKRLNFETMEIWLP
jgi:hypothetical protein